MYMEVPRHTTPEDYYSEYKDLTQNIDRKNELLDRVRHRKGYEDHLQSGGWAHVGKELDELELMRDANLWRSQQHAREHPEQYPNTDER